MWYLYIPFRPDCIGREIQRLSIPAAHRNTNTNPKRRGQVRCVYFLCAGRCPTTAAPTWHDVRRGGEESGRCGRPDAAHTFTETTRGDGERTLTLCVRQVIYEVAEGAVIFYLFQIISPAIYLFNQRVGRSDIFYSGTPGSQTHSHKQKHTHINMYTHTHGRTRVRTGQAHRTGNPTIRSGHSVFSHGLRPFIGNSFDLSATCKSNRSPPVHYIFMASDINGAHLNTRAHPEPSSRCPLRMRDPPPHKLPTICSPHDNNYQSATQRVN